MSSPSQRIARALEFAVRYGGIDGAHHKAWVIDQMVRALTGCTVARGQAIDVGGRIYEYGYQAESEEYRAFVADACDGEDGPGTYAWDTGSPP